MGLDLPRMTYGQKPGFTPRPKKGSGKDERTIRNPPPVKAKPERKGVSPRLRAMVMERDKFCCVLCGSVGTKENPLHIGHIIPVAQDGVTAEENLRVECAQCNLGGGARRRDTPKERIDGNKIVSQLAAIVGKKRSK